MAWPLGWFDMHSTCRAYRRWKSANRFYYRFAFYIGTISLRPKGYAGEKNVCMLRVSHNKLNQHYLILWSKGGRSFSKVFRSLYLVLIDFDGWLTDRPTNHFHANRIIYACGVQVTHKCSSWNMKLNKSSMHYSKPDKLLNHSIEYISLLFWSTATTSMLLFVLWVI